MQACENPDAIDSTENQVVVSLEQADKLFEEGKFKEALAIYKAYREKLVSSKEEELKAETDIILNQQIGLSLLELLKFREAKPYLLKAAELQNTFDPHNKIKSLSIKLDLSRVYLAENSSDQVENTFETCLALLNQISKKAEKDLVICYNKLSQFCFHLNRYEKAFGYASDAIELNSSLITLERATSLKLLGHVYFYFNNFEEAYECYSNSEEILSSLNFPKCHPETLILYARLGNVNNELKDYEEAVEYLEKFLKHQKEISGENHCTFSWTYYELGRAQFELGELDEALESLDKSLEAHKKSLGENPNQNSGLIYELRGKILFTQENYLEAIENYEDALQANKQVFGEDSLEVSNNYHQLGELYLDRWRVEQADLNLNKAFQIRLKYPDKKLLLADSESKLASLCTLKREYYKSLTIQMKSIKTIRNGTGDYSRESVECMFALSDLFDNINCLSLWESSHKRVHQYDKKRDEIDYEINATLMEIEQKKCLTDLNKFEI